VITKKLFLASSAELKADRSEFEIFISRKNKDWVHKGVFLDLVIWEDFLDAVSQTRLQDEYNKSIRDCDLFIMLFWTKVVQYTKEEFETAFGQFKSTNRPLIFTYFRNTEIKVTAAMQKDLMSLWTFQEKLNALGHFYTVYENVNELKFKFDEQLDKLVANGFIEFAAQTNLIAAQVEAQTARPAQITGSISGGTAGVVGAGHVVIEHLYLGPSPPAAAPMQSTDAPPNAFGSPQQENSFSSSVGGSLKIVLGQEGDFATVEAVGLNRRKIVRVQIRNNSGNSISNCKLELSTLDPPNHGTTDCLLKENILLGPHADQFIDIAYYNVGSTRALPDSHIHLAVPRTGGFFAEAFQFANLPLISHSLTLRLARYSTVFDAVPCILRLDDRGSLKLERDEGSVVSSRRPSIPIAGYMDADLLSLYDAAVRANDSLPREMGDFGRETFAKDDPNALLVWWCNLLAPRLTIFGKQLPSDRLTVYSEHEHKSRYELRVENRQIVVTKIRGEDRWVNLAVREDTLNLALRQLGSTTDY
jgi:hypothetical protein